MRYAETGVVLEIDLSRGNIERTETDPRLTELHLGGQGTADRILWDRVPPEVDPLSPDNVLIFSTGLLTGTPVPGANRTIVNSIFPQTNLHAHSIMGGFWGPELKHAGYDKVILKGRSPSLVYLWIKDDKVEIRDARHLHGKGARETADLIRQELKDNKAQVAAIGLAGENRVYMSTIEHSTGSASRGVGMVMGDKRVKAIAVRGTKDINIARPSELFELCNALRKQIDDHPEKPKEYMYGWRSSSGDPMAHDHNDSWHTDNFAWGYARDRKPGFFTREVEEKWSGLTERVMDREVSCYNCPKNCTMAISYPGRPRNFVKCFNKLMYAMEAHQELDFSYDILAVTQEYGMDGYALPLVLALAVELYRDGVLTDKEMPGFPSDPAQQFFWLTDKIARREGIGDILANGTYWACRQIKGAEKYDHNTIKKCDQVPIKLGTWNRPYFLMYVTGEKMSIPQIEGSFPQVPFNTREEREEFASHWEAVPDERFKKWWLEWEPRSHLSFEASCAICDWNELMHYVDDAVGMCAFLSSFRGQFGGVKVGGRPPYHLHNLPKFISLATGMDMDEAGLWEIARRNRNLVRAINIRRGLKKADEKVPENQWRRREPPDEAKLLDMYYEFKGWNNQGVPTRQTLHGLGLDNVADDLEQRGFLASEGASAGKAVAVGQKEG